MNEIFLKLLNMSITASWLVLAVILLRFVLKRAPKWLNTVLWAFVGFRLICPFSFESIFSLVPSVETVPSDIIYSQSPAIHSGVPALNSTINPIISESFAPDVSASVNPLQIITAIAAMIWIIGIVGMILYAVVSYVRLHKKVQEGVVLKDNIWLCDRIETPFILGIIKPRIFLPSGMAESDMEYVIAHEKAHLKRHDHLWKPLGFLLLTVYWFNPVIWIAYILLCRDIELACDEKVIKEMGAEIKKPYSEALINCSVSRRTVSACPLAFGETGVKGRIKSVLSYKKPAFWVIIIGVVSCVVVAMCFLTNPKSELKDSNPELDKAVSQAIFDINAEYDYHDECKGEGHIVYGVKENGNNVTVYLCEKFSTFGFKNGYFMEQSSHVVPAVFTLEKNEGGYTLLEYEYAEDGERYPTSIKRMFPKKYEYRVLNPTEKDNASLWAQCVEYAEEYLEKIGRDAEVRAYSEVEHTLLTDVGVSVDISNLIMEMKLPYDSDIGWFEKLEDGIRYVYRTAYEKDKNLIVFTKELYGEGENGTNQIIETIEVNSLTGDIVSVNSYPYELPEVQQTDNTYNSPVYLDYTKAADEVRNEYRLQAIHYPVAKGDEAKILLGEAYGSKVADYLDNVSWRKSTAPLDDLSSPGSVEFVIDEDYRVSVYKRKSGSVFAYAVVKTGNDVRYYHAAYDDYEKAVAILHAPEKITVDAGGYHSYSYITDNDSAYISINPADGRVFFSLSSFSSYVCYGTYTETDEQIIIVADDMKHEYTFSKDGENLIFEADMSTKVPEYRYSQDATQALPCIPDGAVFESHGYEQGYIDKVYADIDNDGIKEDCILGYGPTSGLFTVTFSVYESGVPEYFNIFNSTVDSLCFETADNGKVKVKGESFYVSNEYDTVIHYFDISIKDGNIVLTSNDEMMEYWGEQGLNSSFAPFNH